MRVKLREHEKGDERGDERRRSRDWTLEII
jgi:hypothetical protein